MCYASALGAAALFELRPHNTCAQNLFGSAFEHWHYTRPLGTWDKDRSILFHVDSSITFNPLAVPAVVVLGVVGGIAGALTLKRGT